MKSANELREILNAPADPGIHFIADPRHYEKEVLDGYSMDVVKYGNEIDAYCPAKMGELTCIIGHTNVGKTTAILWMLSFLVKQGKRILIYSAENRISSIHKQIIRFCTGHINISVEDLAKFRSNIKYIKHERHFSYRDMLNQATYLLDAGFEFDFFFIDPYNSLKIENSFKLNTHDYHYQAAEEMRIFAMNTDKSIYLNCHTVTEAQRVKPDNNGHRPAPMDSDVEGGGKFPNKADNTIVLHRQISSMLDGEKFITEIHVRKVRNQEFGGEPTPYSSPLRFKYRVDRTGFDFVGGFESKLNDYKQVSFDKNYDWIK
jgi:energy-coupling factor transporter ATP-binding protein EcfA2